MPEVQWSALAISDLTAILDYIADDNPAAALALLEDIKVSASRLSSMPERGRPGRVEGTRELVVRAHYIIIHDVIPERITVRRILHAARQWP